MCSDLIDRTLQKLSATLLHTKNMINEGNQLTELLKE